MECISAWSEHRKCTEVDLSCQAGPESVVQIMSRDVCCKLLGQRNYDYILHGLVLMNAEYLEDHLWFRVQLEAAHTIPIPHAQHRDSCLKAVWFWTRNLQGCSRLLNTLSHLCEPQRLCNLLCGPSGSLLGETCAAGSVLRRNIAVRAKEVWESIRNSTHGASHPLGMGCIVCASYYHCLHGLIVKIGSSLMVGNLKCRLLGPGNWGACSDHVFAAVYHGSMMRHMSEKGRLELDIGR